MFFPKGLLKLKQRAEFRYHFLRIVLNDIQAAAACRAAGGKGGHDEGASRQQAFPERRNVMPAALCCPQEVKHGAICQSAYRRTG